ncbi:MAG: nucleoside hydrolase [Erysipelotrichaceae bacterium]|nr:nucleoside hydrolase [Erysipelotrichaceae bacterium]MBQ6494320.1 nucleoside hydrolase [Erysipelotrichaceae bacterium]
MAKTPVWMDVDTGLDDAMALLLLSACEDIELLGISTVFGNQSVERTAVNTLKICELMGIDVSVAAGASKGILEEQIDYSKPLALDVHGQDGLGNIGNTLPEPNKKLSDLCAVDLMAEKIRNCPDKVTIVATAPLTNIATFILTYPDLTDRIEKILFMGGAVFGGNIKPSVEANMGHDPEAAYIVISSDIPKVMFGLDATMMCPMNDQERFAMRDNGGKVGAFLCDALQHYSKLYQDLAGLPGAVLHDSLPMAYLIDPSVVEIKEFPVEVELSNGITKGCTVTDTWYRSGKENNLKVAMSADREKLIKMHLDAVKRYA